MEDLDVDGWIILYRVLEKRLESMCGLDSRGLLQRPVADAVEVDNKTSASIKCRKLADYVTKCQLQDRKCFTVCQ